MVKEPSNAVLVTLAMAIERLAPVMPARLTKQLGRRVAMGNHLEDV